MIINFHKGQNIFAKRTLTEFMIRRFKYAHETMQYGGGFMPGTDFKITEVNWASPGSLWMKIAPGSDPKRTLKISKEEFSQNFKTWRG